MDTFSTFEKRVFDIVEKTKSWRQPLFWEDEEICQDFSFPVEYQLEDIKAFLRKNKCDTRTKGQRTVPYETYSVKYIKFRCAARFRKRKHIKNRKKRTSSKRAQSSDTTCSWTMNLKKVEDHAWTVTTSFFQHENHFCPSVIETSSIHDDWNGVVTKIGDLTPEIVEQCQRLFTAFTPTSCIRQVLEDQNVKVGKSLLQNLRRYLDQKSKTFKTF
jgi:hypothetical protein